MASYRFNGTIGDTNGKILDVSKHNRHIIYSPSGDPMYTTNDLGKSNNIFKNGYPIAQRLDKVTSTGLPVDRIGSVGLPTFTNNGCKKFDGVGDLASTTAKFLFGTNNFTMRIRFRLTALTFKSGYRGLFGRWDPSGTNGDLVIRGTGTSGTGSVGFVCKGGVSGTSYPGMVFDTNVNLGTSVFHVYEVERSGNTITIRLDGVSKGTVTLEAGETLMLNKELILCGSDSTFSGGPIEFDYAEVILNNSQLLHISGAGGPSSTIYDRSSNGNHFAITTTSGIDTMATTSDLVKPWNILNGFSVVAMGDGTSYYQTTIRPTLSDKLEIQFNGNSTSTNGAIIGVFDVADGTKRFLLYSDGNRYLRCVVGGTLTVLSQTAILDNMWHTVIIDCVAQTLKLDDAAPVAINIAGLALTSDLRVFGSIGVGGSVALCSYIKYWQSGILTQHLRPNRNGELVNLLDGSKAVTVGTGITIQYIPSIVDRSADVLGNEVMYPGRMSIHNGAESTLTQTDSNLLTNEFWSSDGITFDDKTYDDLLACDGSHGVYVSKEGSNITEILTESFNGNDPNNIDGYSANLGVQLDAFTIFGTFKCNDVYSSRDHSICALYDISDNLLFKIKLVGDVDKYLVFTGSDDGIGNSSSNIIVNDKNIHSFACTFDGENWNIYIDGDFNSTEIDEYSSTETIVLKVGKCDSDSFLGNIGNIRIYNTVLESNDIQLLHVEAMNPPMAVAINGTPLEELIESINSEKLGWLNDPLVGEWLNDPLVGEWLNNPLSGASLSGFRVVLGTIDGFNDYSGNSNEFTVSEGIVGNGIILNNGKINWEESTFESYMYVFEPTDGSGIKFCSYSEGIHRVNLVEDEPPLTITSTGMSETASGKIHKVEAYNYDIPFPLLKLLYLKESRYF